MNVITEYNKNNFETILTEFIAKNKKLTRNGNDIYNGSKKIATINTEKSIVEVSEMSNHFDVGEYTAFDLFALTRYKGDEKTAYLRLLQDRDFERGMEKPYIRVGIDYFKRIKDVDRYGIENYKLKKWNRQELRAEFGDDYTMFVENYDDFTIQPDNINYKGANGNMYNLYARFPHTPYDGDVKDEDIKWTLILMKHIFGDQWGTKDKPLAGIKYMKIMYENPIQPLPILSLVSSKRGTGKSTFVDYLTQLYNANMIIINPEDISSTFNGGYATKNIIAIEESRFENVQALEKLKALSTQKKISVNEKFISNYSIPFFGKIIIASNDETKFVKIDEEEIRYWVRQIPVITIENLNILDDLRKEIPYFLKWLLDVPKFQYKGRHAIPQEETTTHILDHVKKESQCLPKFINLIGISKSNKCAMPNTFYSGKFKFNLPW